MKIEEIIISDYKVLQNFHIDFKKADGTILDTVVIAGYVEDILPDRTYEKWGYEQVPQSHIMGNDFPIGVK